MPRMASALSGGMCRHLDWAGVLNRGNGIAEVSHDDPDYAAFTDLLAGACERLPMRVLGWLARRSPAGTKAGA